MCLAEPGGAWWSLVERGGASLRLAELRRAQRRFAEPCGASPFGASRSLAELREALRNLAEPWSLAEPGEAWRSLVVQAGGAASWWSLMAESRLDSKTF